MDQAKQNKIWAVVSYIPPCFLILLILKRKNELVFCHSKQALGAWLVAVLAYSISLIPGQFFTIVKWPISLTAFSLTGYFIVYGIAAAAQAKNCQLPLIGEHVDGWSVFNKIQGK